jgi:hypothetical protein
MASDLIYKFQKLSLRGTKVINGNQISGRTDAAITFFLDSVKTVLNQFQRMLKDNIKL